MINIVLVLPNNFFAQNENHKINSEPEDHFHHNHIALFVGASTLLERDHTSFTLGADYIRYFSPESDFAAGVYTEAIFSHHTEWLFGVVFFYGLTEHLWVRTGPGIEILQEDLECGYATKTKAEFLIRIGAGYSIHFGNFSVDPSIDIDLLRSSTTLVWGLNFGTAF
jgi:hypothetical protein